MTARPFVVVVVLLAAACATASPAPRGPNAVATAYPLSWVTSAVAPNADVRSLVAGGADAHDAELSPQQQAALQTADVVVTVGEVGFQPHVDEALSDAAGRVVAATDVVGDDRLLRDSSGAVDPHVWFDPEVMGDVARQVATAFAEVDPDNAESYRRNAAATAEDLAALDDEISGRLDSCAHDVVVVGHEAYAYLLEPHGLAQQGVSEPGAHSEASPQRIAQLVRLVRERDIPAVLSEAVEGREDAEVVAREAGVDIIEVASLDVVTDQQAARGYPDLIRAQVEAVATAAGCRV